MLCVVPFELGCQMVFDIVQTRSRIPFATTSWFLCHDLGLPQADPEGLVAVIEVGEEVDWDRVAHRDIPWLFPLPVHETSNDSLFPHSA